MEAQETSAPLISQLLALIKCTNSRVKISHRHLVLLVVARLKVPSENSLFSPLQKYGSFDTHLAVWIYTSNSKEVNIYAY